MRDLAWLEGVLQEIWKEHFADVEMKNPIIIRFGRKSKRRLGSIILTKDNISRITVTGLFMDEFVPEYVVYETIAHELIHYIHGFSSTLERQFTHPHQGGIIRIEMKKRGLEEIYHQSKVWLSEYWISYTKAAVPVSKKKRRLKKISIARFLVRKIVIK